MIVIDILIRVLVVSGIIGSLVIARIQDKENRHGRKTKLLRSYTS